MESAWLSIIDYARRNQVSDMTVRRHIKSGKLKAVLRDGKYFIPIEGATDARTPLSVADASEAATPIAVAAVSESAEAPAPAIRSVPRPAAPPTQAPRIPKLDELVFYCEEALTKLESGERRLEELYQAKIEAYELRIQNLQEQLKQKGFEANVLKQQIDDLETLVRILDQAEHRPS